jgi:hypothetical protein
MEVIHPDQGIELDNLGEVHETEMKLSRTSLGVFLMEMEYLRKHWPRQGNLDNFGRGNIQMMALGT